MTTRDGFTRLIDIWLAEEGAPTTPDYLDLVLGRTSSTRQRPAWLSPGRWLPMERRPSIRARTRCHRSRGTRLLTALLIVLALTAVVLFAGSQPRRVPAPFGPAANGLIYFDVDGDHRGHEPRRRRAPDDRRRRARRIGTVREPGRHQDRVRQHRPDERLRRQLHGGRRGRIRRPQDLGRSAPRHRPDLQSDLVAGRRQLAFATFHEGFSELFIAKADGSGVRAVGDRDLYGAPESRVVDHAATGSRSWPGRPTSPRPSR